MDDKLKLIEKYQKKRKEKKVVDLIIRDYDQSNFYIALVYNERIEKYKVMFVPLDVVDGDNVEDYVCYQFIKVQMAKYIIDTMDEFNYLYLEKDFRERKNPNINNYYIEFNAYKEKKNYKFTATKYIPKDWLFLYEVIVLLFEHLPHIVSELCVELLKILNNNSDVVEYQLSYNFDIYNDDFEKIFTDQAITEGEKIFNNKQVKFIEKVNDKYFAIVKEHIVIVEYNERNKILNLYCDNPCSTHQGHLYAAILNILNNKFRSFYKVKFNDFNGKTAYYLCYGIDGDNIKVIHSNKERLMEIDLFRGGFMQILEDPTRYLEKSVLAKLEKMHSKEVVEKIAKNIRGQFPR